MAPSLPTHVETNNNKSGTGSIQVNAPIIIGGTSKWERVCKELLATIGPPKIEPRPAQGTCRWILNDDKFQSWRTSSDQHLLWISGRPGKGKSHLAAFLGQQLSHPTAKSSRSPLVVKFSCDNTNVRRSTSLAVHLNVLHQLVKFHRTDVALHDDASSILNDIHTNLNRNLPRDDLWGVITGFINRDIDTTDHLTYFILDGLDECDAESIQDLSKKLQHLCSTESREGRPHFKAILLSRPLPNISNRDLWIDLDDDLKYGEQILHEIRVFIEAEMRFTLKERRAELEKLKDILSERSNKTFLWVSLALKLLRSDKADLEAILSGRDKENALDRLLPVGLPSMYNRMLLEVLRGKYDGQRNFDPKSCAKMLQFVCVAFQPLTLAELQGAVDPSFGASAIIGYCEHILVQSSDETVVEHTEELLDGVDQMLEGNTNVRLGEKTFQLVHLSLKEYLQQPRRFTFPAPLGLLLWPYLSSTVDVLRPAAHSFYYLDQILFGAVSIWLNEILKRYPAVGFVVVSLFAFDLWNRWKQKSSWMIQLISMVLEFLLDHCVLGIFAASEQSCHRDLFLRSLAFLMDKKSGLQRETMENLDAKGALSAEKPKSVNANLAPFGRYACRFWADHFYGLYEVDWTPREEMSHEKLVFKFLENHLLDWLSSLSLQGNLRDGALSMRRLIRIFKNRQGGNQELEPFLKDTERFMMQFVPITERAPFQVYGAALVFCPNNSPVKSTFRDRVLPFAKKIKYPHDDWSPILQVLEGHKYDVTSIAFSNDGKLIASASGDDKICLWDTETGSLKRRLRIENAALENITFSPRGQLIASGSHECENEFKGMIWVWDEQTGELVRAIDIGFRPRDEDSDEDSDEYPYDDSDDDSDDDSYDGLEDYFPHPAIACSPDGDVLAIAFKTSIQLWHLENEKENFPRSIPTPSRKHTYSMAFSPDGYLIASRSERIIVWDVKTRDEKFTIGRNEFLRNEHWHPGQKARLDSLAFSTNGSAIASGLGHGALQLWDPETGEPSEELLKHRFTKMTVAFSPDGTMVASSYDSSIRLWDSKSCSLLSEQLPELKKPRDNRRRMILSSDKKILGDFSGGKTINIWKLEAGTLTPLGTRFRGVDKFAFSPRCDILAFTTSALMPRIRIWNVTEGRETHALDQIVDELDELSFSSDGNTLVVLLRSSVRLLDPATGTTRQLLESPTGNSLFLHNQNDTSNLLSFCPKTGSIAFPIGQDKERAIEIWHSASPGGPRVHLEDSTGDFWGASFSPDGAKIAVSYPTDDYIIRVWDTETGQLEAKIESPLGPVSAMGFSPDNRQLMMSADESPVKIWELRDGTCTDTVRVTKAFLKLALSDCGNYLTTNRGVVDIGHNGSRRGCYVDGEWIVRGQERILWLPPDMRTGNAFLVNDLLILGCVSGRVELVQF